MTVEVQIAPVSSGKNSAVVLSIVSPRAFQGELLGKKVVKRFPIAWPPGLYYKSGKTS
jgi:hypothetical protein